MLRDVLNRLLPARTKMKRQWFLRPFKALLHDPALWATHRKNVLKAFALGLFACFLPIPGQTILPTLIALWLRVNLPVVVLASWIANPVTVGPLYYSCYRLGGWLLDIPPGHFPEAFTVDWLWQEITRIWQPLLLGCLLVGVLVTTVSVVVLNRLWIHLSRQRFRERRRFQTWRLQAPK